jgi:pimeloyl-ACP methyl ester carboxylesterase
MDRRAVLQSVAIGAGAAALSSAAAAPSQRRLRRAPPFIETRDGERLFMRDWGEGPPLVFLAGWTISADFWAYQMTPLADQGMRCIAYDRRGHGRSSQPDGGYGFDSLADDLAEILDTLDLHETTLVGHSMAGGELARYTSRHGDRRIARLIFVAPTTPFLRRAPDHPEGIDPIVFDRVRATLHREYHKWLADNTAPFFTPGTPSSLVDWARTLSWGAGMRAAIACHRSMTETDFRRDLAAVRKPTLVVHGDADASAPVDFTGRRTAALIPGARLQIYEGAPHGLPLTHAERLNADILSFVRS